ncbi:TonB-dependent receptor [Phytopseudomonas dryadis]|uniref:TonB-dependent receptor n=1 Tax=Phytopseudomonas dryadis TaxID=2487520 RepID=A0A4Q9R300_9GAMM|nr:TonB-dependent receptor [Pseudomonas dryadis]TBU94016.1 TonB-dependent receptor [Pseudomonas dryadis]
MFERSSLSLAVAWGIAALAGLYLGASTPLMAAEPQSTDSSPTLQKVVVTAQKREESVQEVPATISVLGGDDIREASLQSANEIARYVPNVSAGTSEGHGRPRWWIRGLGTGDQSATTVSPVGIYMDDVYLANISATGFPLFDLERVEVLRGPQGTLWGKNTTGGAINFISRKPTFARDGYFKIDLGNYANRAVEGAYGDTLVADRLAARVSFRTQGRDGYNENIADGNDRGRLEDSAVRLQLLAALSDDLDATLNLHSRHYRDTGSWTSVAYGTRADGTNQFGYAIDPKKGKVNYNAGYQDEVDHHGASLTLNKQLANLELTSITAIEDFRRSTLSDSDNTPLELRRGYGYADGQQLSQEFRLASPREDRLNWVLGFHYFHEDLQGRSAAGNLDNSYTPRIYNRTDYDQKTESYALFGSSTYNVTERFSLTAGLRWTRESKSIDLQRVQNVGEAAFNGGDWWKPGSVTSPLAVNVVQDDKNTWSDYTYDLTPEYQLSDNARVYFRYARGFRSGGYDTGASTQASVSVVDPEYLTSYELGFKSEWFDGRLNVNASTFYYDYEDIQLNIVALDANNVSTSHLTNGAKAEVYGAEFEIEAAPVDNLHLNFGLGLLHAEFLDYTSNGIDYSGNKLVRAPSVSAVAGVDYRIPLDKGGALILGTDWNTRSKHYFFSNNQTDSMRSAGYTLGNARVTYELPGGKTWVTGYVNNLTDKEYRNHTLPSAFSQAVVMFGDPRTFGISATTTF